MATMKEPAENGENVGNLHEEETNGEFLSSESKDNASVDTGTNTQTRFSFYNAQDFVQQATPDVLKQVSPTSSPRNNKHKESSHHNRDSVEILRSLQEHEQQRLEILGGEQAALRAGQASSSHDSNAMHVELSTLAAGSGGGASSDSSNPYEDAIKEALDLLRKHRSNPSASQASTPAMANQNNLMLPVTAYTPGATSPRSANRMTGSTQQQQQQAPPSPWMEAMLRTPPEADRVLQSRGGGEAVFFPENNNSQVPLQQQSGDGSNTPSAVALGEAYQAEIEARRKQRQERMARYATRLAELKQEDKYAPDNNNTHSNSNSNNAAGGAMNGSSNSDVGQSRKWGGPHLDALASSWQPTVEAAPTSRSVPATFPLEPSQAGTMSSLSKEDEVQRGVERVLLAILERANSQGRGGRSNHSSNVDEPLPESVPEESSATEWATSTSREEKKAASPEDSRPSIGSIDQGDNVITRAMTDLLGVPSTSSLGSSSPNRNAMQNFLEISGNLPAQPHPVAEDTDDNQPKSAKKKKNLTVDTSFQEQQRQQSKAGGDRSQEPEDDLDKMVRTVLIQDTTQVNKQKQDDSFDRRVRSVLSPDPNNETTKSQEVSPARTEDDEEEDDDDEEEDSEEAYSGVDTANEDDDHDSTESSERDDDSAESAFTDNEKSEIIDDEEVDDDDEDEDDIGVSVEEETQGADEEEDHPCNRSELDGVLGPLSHDAGGTTGVVLEVDDSPEPDSVGSPSILDSLSAAVSMVAGTLTNETLDKYASPEIDDETNELMRTLCAHLLPSDLEQSTRFLEKRPDWDESNPDEAGYRIIRLTTIQLMAVENAYERIMNEIKRRKEEQEAEKEDDDDAFERDLKAAEDILDGHERETSKLSLDAEIEARATIYTEHKPLEEFPGVKSTGQGEMGDLEYFHLPIIFKSHVTGFEPTKDMVLESGNVVAGQYLVEGELGSAAFSTAYKCVDLNSEGDGPDGHEEVCLKVIKNTKDFFDQSLDEIKILELLRQTGMCQEKNLVEMRTFFYHREHLIIVTELLRQNLFEFGKFIIDSEEEPYFTMSRLCYLTRQILVALDFVHKLGLVHSDVKPENILLSSYSRARSKLIDFGSSCYLTDRQSSYIQSRSYRAPEVILGLPYDGRIDVWSLGCVVAEMFTGEVTFQNDSIVSMLSRIEAICGAFPLHMISQGRQSGRFFTKWGLLFEKLDNDSSNSDDSEEDDDTSTERQKRFVDVFQPKVTSLSSRLGFAADLMERYDSGKKMPKEENRQAMFVDFVRKLLTIDPEKRPTAAEALNHPWMQYAETLEEEDIKYPSC